MITFEDFTDHDEYGRPYLELPPDAWRKVVSDLGLASYIEIGYPSYAYAPSGGVYIHPPTGQIVVIRQRHLWTPSGGEHGPVQVSLETFEGLRASFPHGVNVWVETTRPGDEHTSGHRERMPVPPYDPDWVYPPYV